MHWKYVFVSFTRGRGALSHSQERPGRLVSENRSSLTSSQKGSKTLRNLRRVNLHLSAPRESEGHHRKGASPSYEQTLKGTMSEPDSLIEYGGLHSSHDSQGKSQ